ncbi:MAG: enoyl-CoA hydratase/isomerase family protein [Proteobacteria bacterium]|nr:enoyl-CoA hydratase/isomerase family protein [Pseudomonadota bacterium]MDA1299060.1 enoyl-CoA hydratase/isomerase family protein [Pseudomonadota bacterium]
MSVVTNETNEGIRLVTLNRPDALNAFSLKVMDALCEEFMAAAKDDSVKVLVLTGAGRAFSAGADLKAKAAGEPPAKHGLQGLLDSIIEFPKPFIIAANGLGVGIGCTILGLADMAFVAESSRFRCPFSALGITAEASSTYTFSRLVGHQQASWILLSSEWISSKDCVDAGLAIKSYPDDGFLDSVMEHARTLARLPMASLLQTKALILAPHREQMKQAVLDENAALATLSGGPANREAVGAFMEKRDPDFSGL